jgi:hypothetical protein
VSHSSCSAVTSLGGSASGSAAGSLGGSSAGAVGSAGVPRPLEETTSELGSSFALPFSVSSAGKRSR